MMLFKISLKNIQKSFKDYAIYFFTLILGVAIFYVFNSLESQTVLLNISKSTKQIVKLMIEILSGVSVFVSFVLGFLIIYASRFLIKRRNKEFGIYMTLGMSKGKISRILLIETILIGIISLVIGLIVGVTLSQFMSILVANMFDANLTKFTFIFSKTALIKTIIYFSIMYLFVMIFNTFMINKCKLIDLLHANKKSENIKLKNPILCIIIFIISACVLGFAYYMVTDGLEKFLTNSDISMILVPIALGCLSTFFIFWSVSGLVLKIVMSLKNFYYKNLNSFTLRQISSKVNTMVFSMSVICIMLFLTICILSSSLSIKEHFNNSLSDLVPVDLELEKSANLDEDQSSNKELIYDSQLSIRKTLDKLDFDYNKYLKDMEELNIYYSNDFTFGDSFGSYLETLKKQYPQMDYEYPTETVKLSEYNKIAKLYNNETINLEKNEYAVVVNVMEPDVYKPVLENNTIIKFNENNYKPAYKKTVDGFIHLAGNPSNISLFVLPDEAFLNMKPTLIEMVANYKAENKEEKEKIEKIIDKLSSNNYANNTTLCAISKISIYEAAGGLSAMATFVGLYLGIIFLISSAAILALKELSDSSDNRERFNMLRKIGTDEKMINRGLFNQIAIFFSFPLILAIIHSIFGIRFCNFILSSIGINNLIKPIIMTSIFLMFIYGGYFVITYICSKNIIRNRY